jgi:hypothetical protein
MRKALVVGIDEYPRNPLSYCCNDAREVAELLARNADGTANFAVRTAYNVFDKAELMGMIRELFSGDAEVALLFYAGHGSIAETGGYLVTPDWRNDDFGVSMNDILTYANRSKCRNKIVLLDCCHAGYMGASMHDATAAHVSEGVTILTACRKSESSQESTQLKHGIYTNLLISALGGGAADLQGNVTPGAIYAYIDQSLGPWYQRPVFKTNVTRFVSLRKTTPPISEQIMRSIVQLFPDPISDHSLDPSYEDTNAPDDNHQLVEPYANPENIKKMKDLQKLERVGLVVPVGEQHMYYAAMHSKSCKLTILGQHYWRLAKDEQI